MLWAEIKASENLPKYYVFASVGDPVCNFRDRAIVNACKNSWRAYNLMNATVSTGGLRDPLVGEIGLRNINFINQQFQVVLKAACAVRPNGLIVDVDANVGKFLLNLISIDRNVPYIGLEPLLRGAACIRRLMIDNQLRDHRSTSAGHWTLCTISSPMDGASGC